MALALRSDPPAKRDEAGLDRLLAEGRRFSAEFPVLLANHLPMVLVAMHRLGGSDKRLGEFFEHYRDANKLQPVPPRRAPIERSRWTDALGRRESEADYRDFFEAETARLGARAVMSRYLPTLLPGLAASATHGLMRLGYGVMRDDRAEIAVALGYWAATYLELGAATGAQSMTDDPGDVLLRMRAFPTFRDVTPELDLLWHFMRAVSEKPEFRPMVDWLAVGPDTGERIAAAALALYAGTMDFCALHAITGRHWLRMIDPLTPDRGLALRYFWQAIAALYPKIGFPDLPDAQTLDAWRALPCPDWSEITEAAVRSNDEHDLSLVFSAREEWAVVGDPLYRIVAARRVRLTA